MFKWSEFCTFEMILSLHSSEKEIKINLFFGTKAVALNISTSPSTFNSSIFFWYQNTRFLFMSESWIYSFYVFKFLMWNVCSCCFWEHVEARKCSLSLLQTQRLRLRLQKWRLVASGGIHIKKHTQTLGVNQTNWNDIFSCLHLDVEFF